MPTLVLLRHGESAWSRDRFAGWVDVDLSPRGVDQARRSGELLRAAGLLPTVAHTSLLTRAVRTGALALAAAGCGSVPAHRTWRLNERHYGALQGVDRRTARLEHGDTLYRLWRRSYDHRPPPVAPGSEWDVAADPRYADLPPGTVPRSESLRDVMDRLLPYWHASVVPDLRAGGTVLVTAHGNSLRALVAHLDHLSDAEVLDLDIPTGMPLRYDLDPGLVPRVRGGAYLEPEAASAAAAEVAAQGR